MTEQQNILRRLLAGETIFLPGVTWRTVNDNGGGRLYADVRAAGRFLHFHRHVDMDGAEGLRVWVDEERGRGGPQRVKTLFAESRSLSDPPDRTS